MCSVQVRLGRTLTWLLLLRRRTACLPSSVKTASTSLQRLYRMPQALHRRGYCSGPLRHIGLSVCPQKQHKPVLTEAAEDFLPVRGSLLAVTAFFLAKGLAWTSSGRSGVLGATGGLGSCLLDFPTCGMAFLMGHCRCRSAEHNSAGSTIYQGAEEGLNQSCWQQYNGQRL